MSLRPLLGAIGKRLVEKFRSGDHGCQAGEEVIEIVLTDADTDVVVGD